MGSDLSHPDPSVDATFGTHAPPPQHLVSKCVCLCTLDGRLRCTPLCTGLEARALAEEPAPPQSLVGVEELGGPRRRDRASTVRSCFWLPICLPLARISTSPGFGSTQPPNNHQIPRFTVTFVLPRTNGWVGAKDRPPNMPPPNATLPRFLVPRRLALKNSIWWGCATILAPTPTGRCVHQTAPGESSRDVQGTRFDLD